MVSTCEGLSGVPRELRRRCAVPGGDCCEGSVKEVMFEQGFGG